MAPARRRSSPHLAPWELNSLERGLAAERNAAESPIRLFAVGVRQIPDSLLFEITCDEARIRDEHGRSAALTDDLLGLPVKDKRDRWRGTLELILDDRKTLLVELVADSDHPRVNDIFTIAPLPFLRALHEWSREQRRLPAHFTTLLDADQVCAWSGSTPSKKPGRNDARLRDAQRIAVDTSFRPFSVVWGPPGTGKTTTMGAIAAAHLAKGHSVLAVSTTNVAVDVLTVAIDDACRTLGLDLKPGEIIRAGRPQTAALTQDPTRQHLLLWSQTLREFGLDLRHAHDTIRIIDGKLRVVQLDQKDRDELLKERAAFRRRVEELIAERARILDRLAREARLVATTITGYVGKKQLNDRHYDVTLVDEASMVSAAAACRLLSDDRKYFCFGGDFQQLPPICKASQDGNAARWIASSVFDAMNLASTVARRKLRAAGVVTLLDEQSRMSAAICDMVSHLFYEGVLKTIGTSPQTPAFAGWNPSPLLLVDPRAAPVPPGISGLTRAPGRSSSGSWVWDRSLQIARALTLAVLSGDPKATIAVVTPFRAQADNARALIGRINPDRVRAGTIHTMQGSEADVVIFDPVAPAESPFLLRKPQGPILANVAFSRARAQLVLIASPGDIAEHAWYSEFLLRATRFQPDWRVLRLS